MRSSLPQAPRLFCRTALASGATISLDESAARHVQALRLARDAPLTLFDGSGREFAARLLEVSRRGALALVGEGDDLDRESPLEVTLVQGIASGDRMDLVIQKATELGVTRIVPVVTTRSIVRLSTERQERRTEHWQNVAIAACEQCGRNRLPLIDRPFAWHELLASGVAAASDTTRLYLSPSGAVTLRALPAPRSVVLAIGPEGGLAPEEIADLDRLGFSGVRFGPRILRTETAPLAAIAALQAWWGDC